jgi:DNA mismatch repair protein MutS
VAALRQTLQHLPSLQNQLAAVAGHSVALLQVAAGLGGAETLAATLEVTLADPPRATLDEGGVIRAGFDAQLDEFVQLTEHGQQWLDSYETSQRAQTGIANLKVTYNRVSGYGIEISRSRAEQVPAGYHRRQTLKNVERYMTDELAAFERKVQAAEQGRLQRETQLYRELLAAIGQCGSLLRAIGRALAELDVHAAFAELAVEQRYVRPRMTDEPLLWLRRGRHPVIEQLLPAGTFVPNDLLLAGEGAATDGFAEAVSEAAQLLLITGPNMAGKSTLMRQAALAVVLAQAGSFVPAEEAVMGVFDAVLTRIGAGDDITEGASTFLVEMREVAAILARATPRTLVVLDEIGRGTSTYDGLAIAWAVVEQLHDKARSLCLCATHYHELTHLAQKLPRLRNAHVAVHEWQQEVVFVHQLQAGPTSKSHGVAVARLAGLPPQVIERARKLVEQFERSHKRSSAEALQAAASRQLDLFDSAPPSPVAGSSPPDPSLLALRDRLCAVDMDALTPRAAWELLDQLVQAAQTALAGNDGSVDSGL